MIKLLMRGPYWIANAHRMKGRRNLDLRRDPAPDLAIEVDAMLSSLDRLAIYAVLGVSEVWRLDGDVLTFHVLDVGGHFTEAATSQVRDSREVHERIGLSGDFWREPLSSLRRNMPGGFARAGFATLEDMVWYPQSDTPG